MPLFPIKYARIYAFKILKICPDMHSLFYLQINMRVYI